MATKPEEKPETKPCMDLDDLLGFERHVLRHAIEHGSEPLLFIRNNGERLREFYCGHSCVDRYECPIGRQYLPKKAVNE